MIGYGGVGIATYPEGDLTQDQLQSGFINAILNFSQEVHQADLKALNLHDRTISFVRTDDHILLVEFSNAIDETLMSKILGKMEDALHQELDGVTTDNLSEIKAKKLLQNIAGQEWMDKVLSSFGLDRPISKASVHQFQENGPFYDDINAVLRKMEEKTIQPFMLPIREEAACLYVVPIDDTYYYLRLHRSDEIQLFKMVPVLNQEVDFLKNKQNLSIDEFMKRLRNLPDLGYKISDEDEDNISLQFLRDNVSRNLDHAIDAVIKGKQVNVVGEKITTRIVVYTLQLFSQHLITEIVVWLDKEAVDLPLGTSGMSRQKFNDLKSKNLISDDVVVIDLNSKKVEGGESNKYIKKMLKSLSKMNRSEVEGTIAAELNDIVATALEITELISLPKEEAESRIQMIQEKVANQGKFDLILSLSSQRNNALETIVSDISSTLKKAESFLGEF